jgi:NADP-dependent 3-hydroxy acid dehydrogenase YdfG
LRTHDPIELAGRVCVVTGATSGIGRALAAALATGGARVWALGRSPERLAELAQEHVGSTGEVVPEQVDLEHEGAIDSTAGRILDDGGRVDVLVHCAGAVWLGSTDDAPAAELDRLRRVNLDAPVRLTRALLPALARARGQVVFLNSTAALRPSRDNRAYAETKHSLREFADRLRGEVNAAGVRVSSVYAGRTATPMQQAVHDFEGREYRVERLMRPEDVVYVIVACLTLPRTAEVIDVTVRPAAKLAS